MKVKCESCICCNFCIKARMSSVPYCRRLFCVVGRSMGSAQIESRLIRISPRCKISHRYYLHQKHTESMLHWPLPYGEFFFVHQSIVTGRREAQSLWHYIRVEEQRQFIVAFINRRFHFNTPFHWDRTVRQFLDWVADAGLGSFVNSRLDRRTSAGCLPHTPAACP